MRKALAMIRGTLIGSMALVLACSKASRDNSGACAKAVHQANKLDDIEKELNAHSKQFATLQALHPGGYLRFKHYLSGRDHRPTDANGQPRTVLPKSCNVDILFRTVKPETQGPVEQQMWLSTARHCVAFGWTSEHILDLYVRGGYLPVPIRLMPSDTNDPNDLGPQGEAEEFRRDAEATTLHWAVHETMLDGFGAYHPVLDTGLDRCRKSIDAEYKALGIAKGDQSNSVACFSVGDQLLIRAEVAPAATAEATEALAKMAQDYSAALTAADLEVLLERFITRHEMLADLTAANDAMGSIARMHDCITGKECEIKFTQAADRADLCVYWNNAFEVGKGDCPVLKTNNLGVLPEEQREKIIALAIRHFGDIIHRGLARLPLSERYLRRFPDRKIGADERAISSMRLLLLEEIGQGSEFTSIVEDLSGAGTVAELAIHNEVKEYMKTHADRQIVFSTNSVDISSLSSQAKAMSAKVERRLLATLMKAEMVGKKTESTNMLFKPGDAYGTNIVVLGPIAGGEPFRFETSDSGSGFSIGLPVMVLSMIDGEPTSGGLAGDRLPTPKATDVPTAITPAIDPQLVADADRIRGNDPQPLRPPGGGISPPPLAQQPTAPGAAPNATPLPPSQQPATTTPLPQGDPGVATPAIAQQPGPGAPDTTTTSVYGADGRAVAPTPRDPAAYCR